MKDTTINVEETIQEINKQNKRIEELCLEIERLNDYISFYEDLSKKQNKEIERLNKIINKYDKMSFIHEMKLQKRVDMAIKYIEKNRKIKLGKRVCHIQEVLLPLEDTSELLDILKEVDK